VATGPGGGVLTSGGRVVVPMDHLAAESLVEIAYRPVWHPTASMSSSLRWRVKGGEWHDYDGDSQFDDMLSWGAINNHGGTAAYAGCIFSDDGGVTWQQGGAFPLVGGSESTIAELADKSLVAGARMTYGPCRGYFRSFDGGVTWKRVEVCVCATVVCRRRQCVAQHVHDSAADINANNYHHNTTNGTATAHTCTQGECNEAPWCQGATLAYRTASEATVLLATNPTITPHIDVREHLRLTYSADQGKTWQFLQQLTFHSAGYSSMQTLDAQWYAPRQDSVVAVLYETGAASNGVGSLQLMRFIPMLL